MILSHQLITQSAQGLTKTALRYLGKDTSYKDLLASISRLSYLYQRELGPGVRMAYLCRNSPAMVATFFAMTNIRAVNIPINPDAPPEEIEKWLRDSKATHVAVTSDLVTDTREILHNYRLSLPLIEIEKKQGGEYDTSFTPQPEQTPIETDPVLLLRTGGNTGKPKYISFSHRQLLHSSSALKTLYHLSATDRFHTSLPWSHPFALSHGMLLPLMTNTTCVIDHGLQNVEFLDFLIDSRVTRLIGVPSFFLKLLVICKNEKRVLPGIKSASIGMGALSNDLQKAFELLKISIAHCYGQTENLWTISMQDTQKPNETHEKATRGFKGKGLVGLKYKVINSNGDQIEGSEPRIGQLALMGPTVMSGYFEKEKETKLAIRGTWLYTGDLVRLEGEGETLTLTFIGRKEDIIEIHGTPVYFQQVDTVIRSNPFIQDAAAFSVKTSKGKDVIVCAVIKRSGVPLNEKQVLDFCTGSLPDHLIPKTVAFTDLIPRDIGNNVNYSKLRGLFSGITGS